MRKPLPDEAFLNEKFEKTDFNQEDNENIIKNSKNQIRLESKENFEEVLSSKEDNFLES